MRQKADRVVFPVLCVSSGSVYFSASDGFHGRELWVSSGQLTPDLTGTIIVADIRSGPQGSDPRFLINFNGIVVFTAYVDATGNEMYRSGGSAATTYLIKDIYPGPTSSNPSNYVVYNNRLYFQAEDPM